MGERVSPEYAYQILGAQSGSDVYITKPFHPKHVLAAVENILDRRKHIQAYYSSSASAYELHNGSMIHKEEQEFLISVTKIVENHLEDENLSPMSICEDLNITKITLYRKMKEMVDQTPSEFIRTIKLNKVSHLLLSTNMTVQEIMFQCGFNNKSYFYREFTKVYKVTPKEYREVNHL